MDSRFDAFDPSATFDDGTCPSAFPGCMQSDASNYRALANLEDHSCLYQGCTDPTAFNHDPSATLPGDCTTAVFGCLDPLASNFRAGANTASGTCTYTGCTDSLRPNYDATATLDDGDCAPLFPGCTNPAALNYDPGSNQDDGSCFIVGCKATNPTVTINIPCLCDNTCRFRRRRNLNSIPGGALCAYPTASNYWVGTLDYVRKKYGYQYHPDAFSDCVFTIKG